MTLNVTDDDVFLALTQWLSSLFDGNIEVRRGQQNRVPPPNLDNFVVFTEIGRQRVEGNIVEYDRNTQARTIKQKTFYAFQIDVYGDGSGDLATTIALFARDDSVQTFQYFQAMDGCITDMSDPIQAPWVDTEKQVEARWTATLTLQVNVAVTVQQGSANVFDPTTVVLTTE